MEPLYRIHLSVDPLYLDLLSDLVKWSLVTLVFLVCYSLQHGGLSDGQETMILEVYFYVLLGIAAYHLVYRTCIDIRSTA